MKGLALLRNRRFYHTRWFYAIDVPKTKPYDPDYRPSVEPVKFQAFSPDDSKRIDDAFNKRMEKFNTINVNEDHLFQVNLENFTLKPLYWDGPSYEVRKGVWFNEDRMPLNRDLTLEIEELQKKWLAQKDKVKKNGKKGEFQDTFRLKKKEYSWKYVVFVDDERTAFLLSDLYGGSLQLSLLRSTVSQLIQIGASKITKGYEESVSIAEKAKEFEDHVIENAIGLGNISDMISWEFSDLVKFQNGAQKGKESNDIMKNEIITDYSTEANSVGTLYRPVDHLVLSVHGIGQNLGKKYQYVNFAHTVNLLRNNMKKLYNYDKSLQEFNKNLGHSDYENNSRIQVLPITWRHSIGFNTDANVHEDVELPTLRDITVDGIIPLRRLMSDIGLDILLYGEDFYLSRILHNVCDQLNSVFKKFKENNPDYSGKVSLLGHSLGSLIIFDLLSQSGKFPLEFEVDNFFAIGSPVGVFKLIQRTTIGSSNTGLRHQIPNCNNLFNLFHPCDPIAYRMEPLIDKNTSEYEPEWIHHSGGAPDIIADKVKQLFREKELKEETPMPTEVLEKLTKLNYTGRVDYSYQPNLLEADIWSAIKSHVSYFEDMDTAGFVLNQILRKPMKVTDHNVRLLRKHLEENDEKKEESYVTTTSKDNQN